MRQIELEVIELTAEAPFWLPLIGKRGISLRGWWRDARRTRTPAEIRLTEAERGEIVKVLLRAVHRADQEVLR